MSELSQQSENKAQKAPASAGSGHEQAASGGLSRSHVQLKKDLARADGYDAQMQMLAPVQQKGEGKTEGVHAAAAHGLSGSGGGLPYQSEIQKSFGGYDVSNVQAHTDSAAAQGSAAMGAEAYASGNKVAFGKAPDLHTVAHETAHVIQQKAGVSLSGNVGSVGDKYEQNADAVADAVVQGKSAEPLLAEMTGGGGVGGEVQKKAAAPGEITINEALIICQQMGLTRSELLNKVAEAKAPAPAAGPVQKKEGAKEDDNETITAPWLASVWSTVKGFFASMSPATAEVAASPEELAKAEDAASFQNVDGEIDLFATAEATDTYFQGTSPDRWAASHADHEEILEAANQQGVSTPEVDALVGYTGPAYAPMNRFTRGQMKSDYFKQAFGGYCGLASSALGKLGDGQVKQSQRGWRSIPNGDAGIIENLYNREYVDEAGFMSTTANSDQSSFAGPVSLQISATSGVHIGNFSWYPSEGEILFPPGTRFKVKGFTRNTAVEEAWKAWHADNSLDKPGQPWFEVHLEGK